MVVRQRFFAGRSLRDTASDLGVSLAAVRADWSYARAWLLARLEQEEKAQGPGGTRA
jgi:DNA-directed RNA polymerase specialized sigma24 family protein